MQNWSCLFEVLAFLFEVLAARILYENGIIWPTLKRDQIVQEEMLFEVDVWLTFYDRRSSPWAYSSGKLEPIARVS